MSTLNDLHSYSASAVRAYRGFFVTAYAQENPPRPDQTLELYDHEACPFCRKVREVLSELDLEYIERTCPKGDTTKRPFVASKGQTQFPFLIDPNTGTELFESEDIITYLVDEYGGGRGSLAKALSPLNTAHAMVASLVRTRGSQCRSGSEDREQPPELLILWNFEISPYCRKVREVLCELNLDYHVKNVAKKSKRRPELKELTGRVQVPYLVDPNTGKAMFESDEIVAYLEETYA